MNPIIYRTMDGTTETLVASAIKAFSNTLRGSAITSDHSEYDNARALWNGMIDRHPALIARCTGSRDVRHAVNFARDQRMPLSVRGGGHHIAGNAVAEDGLMIDLSQVRSVHVDQRAARPLLNFGVPFG